MPEKVTDQVTGKGSVELALIHYPVINKNRDIIGSAVTNLDLHDIARAARTYGANRLYVVTPYRDQQALFRELLDHWLEGHGARYNARRGEALSLVRICEDLEQVRSGIAAEKGRVPVVLATGAREKHPVVWPYGTVRQKISEGEDFLLLLGTAWGLAQEVIDAGDGILPPITGSGSYNHLSVRSAAAIILDRLLGTGAA